MAVFVVFCGKPGVGKSTIAKALAEATGALWLRVDRIEEAMHASNMKINGDLADGGYAALRAVAGAALEQGFDVIADSVNPVALTRADYRAVSEHAAARHLDVELVCTDLATHERRVRDRHQSGVGPDWDSVTARLYDPMTDADLVVDTSRLDVERAVSRICLVMEAEHG